VYPNEIEGVLKEHAAVEDCLVVGLADPRWGQRVAVIVETRVGHATSLAALQAHARTSLAGYKIPRSMCFVDTIQRHPSGKPDHTWTTDTVASGPWLHDTTPTTTRE
jgi:acyl-CoA synthetase (AMP-forming)/AMP-acid ligase II